MIDHIDILLLMTRTRSTAIIFTFIPGTLIKVGPWLLVLTAAFAFLLAQTFVVYRVFSPLDLLLLSRGTFLQLQSQGLLSAFGRLLFSDSCCGCCVVIAPRIAARHHSIHCSETLVEVNQAIK